MQQLYMWYMNVFQISSHVSYKLNSIPYTTPQDFLPLEVDHDQVTKLMISKKILSFFYSSSTNLKIN
jgi:hypothetical protein